MSTPERRELRRQAQAAADAGDKRPWQHIYAQLLMERGMAIDDKVNTPEDGMYTLEVIRIGVRWAWRFMDQAQVVVARPEVSRTWETAAAAVIAARAVFPDYQAQVIQ